PPGGADQVLTRRADERARLRRAIFTDARCEASVLEILLHEELSRERGDAVQRLAENVPAEAVEPFDENVERLRIRIERLEDAAIHERLVLRERVEGDRHELVERERLLAAMHEVVNRVVFPLRRDVGERARDE